MEVFLIYLYGIYHGVEVLFIILAVSVVFLAIGATIAIFDARDTIAIWKDDYKSDIRKRKEANSKISAAKKFILIKTAIVLIIINILIPPKEIAVAMFLAKPAIQLVKDVADSNRTAKVVNVFDLALDKVVNKLKEK